MPSYILNLTNAGNTAIAAAAISGVPVNITQMAVGTADGALLTAASTALGAEVWRGSIIQQGVNGTTASFRAAIPADSGGWTLREVALFSSAGTMIAYGLLPTTYKPVLGDGYAISLSITAKLVVSNVDTVTVQVDASQTTAVKAELSARAPRPGVISTGAAVLGSTPDNSAFAFGTNNLTVGAWCRLADWTPASTQTLVAKLASNLGLRLQVLTSGVLRVGLGNGGGVTNYDSTIAPTVTDAAWVFICVTLTRAGNAVFYINGAQVGAGVAISAQSAQTLTNTGALNWFSDGSTHVAGTLGEAWIINGALTAAQVGDIFRAGSIEPFKASFTFYTRPDFEQGYGPLFLDLAGNNLPAMQGASGISHVRSRANPLVPDVRNALAPRGGVAFDGTSGAGALVTLGSAGAFGADAFTVCGWIEVPTSAPTAGRPLIVLSDTASLGQGSGALAVMFEAGQAGLYIWRFDTFANSRGCYVANVITNYSGKTIFVAVVRQASSSQPLVYINGVLQTTTADTTSGAAPAWNSALTTTYARIGFRATSEQWDRKIYSLSLYNLALSAAEVLEIFELGGAVPESLKWGSQVALNASAWTNSNYETFSGASATGFTAIETGSSGGAASAPAFTSRPAGKRYRLKYDLTINSGAAPRFGCPGSTTASFTTLSAGTGQTAESTSTTAHTTVGFINLSAADFVLSNVTAVQLGAVVHLPLNDGIGYQLHDQSTNKLDAVMTTSGVSHLIPQRRGYVRGTLTWAGTHESKSLLGQRALPNEAVIERITTKASAGSSGSGVSVGDGFGSTRYVAANSFTTTKENHALANTLPGGITDTDTTITVDPDTSNYTGSIQVEVQYAVTEGTP